MTRAAAPHIISDIQNPESTASRIAALRLLKNDIIGHDQRKEAWVGRGIVPLLSQILAGRRGTGKKSIVGEVNGHAKQQYLAGRRSGRSEEDEACLQAIIIIGSLAQGGPPFISPIAAGDIFPLLLSILSSQAQDCDPSLSLAVLETLNTIAGKFPLYQQQSLSHAKQLSSILYSRHHVETLRRLIISSTSTSSSSSQLSVALAANLIAETCVEESHKAVLAESGVLDALAFKLSTFVVAQGFVLPGAENNTMDPGTLKTLPPAAPPNAQLAPILRAITVIVQNSKSRAEHFISSPAVVTVFPKQIPEFSPNDIKKSPWGATYFSGFAVPRHSATNPIDAILPSVPVAQSKNSNFPPLGSHTSFGRQGNFFSPPLSFSETSASDEEESALISWLFTVILAESGLTRLAAAMLATTLFRLGLAKKHRVPMFGYLLIPLLIRVFEKDYEASEDVGVHENGLISTTLRAKEQAPAILASLVMDSRELQKYAAEGEAIPKLSQMLKESFNAIAETGKPMWNADKQSAASEPTQPELCLGPRGCSPMVHHKMKVREVVLRALAALSLFKEDYRRMICDNGVVPYIIDAMKPYEDESIDALDGNPPSTLLAACSAARSLTRSVSALRTNLIDAGVATPMFTLIKYRDIAVQIAATSVVCNLAMDFSPMKDAIIGANMIPILCEHSHSSNTNLRLESIWALKHIAYNSTNDIKMKIVEELEPGWLKQVICHDPSDPPIRRKVDDVGGTLSLGMGTPNSAGGRVDILNPMEGAEGETAPSHDGDHKMTDTVMPPKPTGLDVSLIDHSRRRKLAVSGDIDQTKQARRDDLQVQEQTLDLLRNLICGVGAPEMIDYLFQEVGQNDLFNILADKLRPKPLFNHGGRKDSASSSSKSIPVPTEILCSVTYIMIHIAAGLSRHRQLLIQHPTLLKLMMPLFNNPDKQVRVNCVWVVINLTIADDQMDHNGCRERAIKLKGLGVMDKLLSLEDDPESDVKERTKTALTLMRALLQ
ncbi:hypothetical protein RJZ56_003295 [Blastomyces dermatitidis]|uniref:Armadillo repeat protein n=2 Tax=Ajellomyces dermatitidis TaxID=5039 RepID=F2TDW7_AJEDA|nr:armadillo repeat protein [Blastomyces dermatitidis ER-3]XP_045281386.1 armadillo repeat protein, variant 1 [Blastomyces dermatitidis ER-3]XP_045281387.1 armadillo repeat protein, variant 2 [Blastomyces dermatitidis ER-3]EGE81430.1 armadillo repeat protein [Blastomyces dermatitidis ATCC 18188]EEQ90655.1 armadillo repeat protein [Blastomyces dermatitidis ER-3]KMW67507.1 armadillo repeat protein, variant 1 [Blastomyces dermatitidis ATCC 18188]KMW67508.1 armadillo repeat protein, variant 2 [Bl